MKPNLDKDTVYLIDGSGYIFRAYFAIRALHSKSGIPTNAVYGFTTMILKLIREHNPKFMAIAFDLKEPSFRHRIYDGYKAHRPPPPADLIPQFSLIHEMCDALGIKRLTSPGFEADDIIGTLTKIAKEQNREVVIVSGDKDFMQLITSGVWLLDELRAQKTGQENFFGPKEVFEKLGVYPERVIDVLALSGDASDNIPGISGIGMKTAVALVQKFGSVEDIIEHAILIKQNAQREKIVAGAEIALISKKLVTIDSDVPLGCSITDLAYSGINKEAFLKICSKLDFHSLLKNIKSNKVSEEESEQNIKVYEDKSSLQALIEELKNYYHIAVYAKNDVRLSYDDQLASIPINDSAKAFIKDLFEDRNKSFVATDAKSHLKVLKQHGIKEFKVSGDPRLASYLLEDKSEPNISLSQVIKRESSLREDLMNAGLLNLYQNIELPLISILAEMEFQGVKIDREALLDLAKRLKSRLSELEGRAYEIAKETFNLGSPQQVAIVLFDKLKLKPLKKTKTGFSTDSAVLERLSSEHELPKLLLEHRMLSKLLGTYAEALPKLIDKNTGRVHTTYNQLVTATGRLSSSDPNLQNIPIRTTEGRKIRRAFVAENGSVLISLDYSQVELRLLSFVSKDPVLLDSFAKDEDVHKRTASEIFEIPLNEVSKEQRSIAKTINFGLLYGMGPVKLAATLKIPHAQAKIFLAKYFEKYQGILSWKERVLAEAKKTKEVRTLFGRRRFVPEITSEESETRSRGERLAINTPIQGSAADIIKKAMIDTDRFLKNRHPAARLIMQVHDELVLEAPKTKAEAIAQEVSRIMSHGHGLDGLFLKVEFGIAENWDDAH